MQSLGIKRKVELLVHTSIVHELKNFNKDKKLLVPTQNIEQSM